MTKFRPVDSLLNPKALVRQARVVHKFQNIFLQGIVGVFALPPAQGTNMSADLSQERRRYDAIKQLIDDAFTVIHLEDRQGQAEVALIIEALVASQLKEEVKEMPHAALVAEILRQVRDGLVQVAKSAGAPMSLPMK